MRRLKERTIILGSQPETGRIIPELGISEIRELIEGNYRIVCRNINAELVEILAIHHSSRDFESRGFM